MQTADTPQITTGDSRLESPLNYAVSARDRGVLKMVEDAVARQNVMLAYQPIVPAGHPDRPAYFEGLIRILDENGRIIPARDFITVVEVQELGRKIDCLSLDFGLRKLREHPQLRLAINMSARSIGYPNWMRTLEAGLAGAPTVAERLILEITETSVIHMPDIVAVFMAELQARGISFALDDFGAGFTSLRYLRTLYFDILKIDGEFIRGVANSADDQALVKSIMSIGRHFDMVTVAESVETAEDARYLERVGVDCMQGYYFGAPTIRPRWSLSNDNAAMT